MEDLRDAATLHQLALRAEGARPATERQYLFYEKLYLAHLAARGIEPTLRALNPEHVRAALAWYRQQTTGPRSRNGEVAAQRFVDVLKRWAKFLEEQGVTDDDHLRRLRRVRVDKVHREPYSQEEVSALWGACRQSRQPERDEALFLLLLDTGMRIGEACALTVQRLMLAERRAVVSGKSRRERVVPIGTPDRRDGGRTVRALSVYLARRRDSPRAGDAVFLARDGYPLTPAGGYDLVQRLGRQAGVTNAHPHRVRHTYCTWYLTVFPGDELGLRRIVGHVSREVMADYVHFADTVVADRARRASPVETWLQVPRLLRRV